MFVFMRGIEEVGWGVISTIAKIWDTNFKCLAEQAKPITVICFSFLCPPSPLHLPHAWFNIFYHLPVLTTVTKRMKVPLVVCMLVLATTLLNEGRGRSFIAKSKKSKKFYLIKTKPARVRDYKMWKTRLEF